MKKTLEVVTDTALKEEFSRLIPEGERQVRLNPWANHWIVVKTAKGNTYHLAGRAFPAGDEDGEKFIQMLRSIGEAEVVFVLCMIMEDPASGPCPFPPVGRFSRQLIAADPKNAQALVVLATETDLRYKELKWTMPK